MVVGAKVLGCLLGGDLLIVRTWMEVCLVGNDVVHAGTSVGSYGTAFVVG